MTYGMIKHVIKGLQYIMQGSQGPSEVFWDLERANWSHLGTGDVVEEVFPDLAFSINVVERFPRILSLSFQIGLPL